jgi:hypothetical protein
MSVIVRDFEPHKSVVLCDDLFTIKIRRSIVNKFIGVGIVAMVLGSGAQASNLEGEWRLQDAGNTQSKLDEAVENVAKEMNFFIRALARPVLKKQTQVCQQWLLSQTENQFQWQCDTDEADIIPLSANGDVIKEDEEGIEIFGTYQETETSVVVVLESERGKRTNTWQSVSENELIYTVKLESEKLPTPLTWSLTYKK